MTAVARKERGIIFSGPMVQAILAGKKTQTRRIVKPQPPDGETILRLSEGGFVSGGMRDSENAWKPIKCPYGEVGDCLWVRETWQYGPEDMVYYKADEDQNENGWKPSISMPRWASRLTLGITGVRVERVQSISAKDIIAEGLIDRPHKVEGLSGDCPVSSFDKICYPDLRSLWWATWCKINGKESWSKNVWVWCIEFKRVTEDTNAAGD